MKTGERLPDLLAELELARTHHEAMARAEETARSNACASINRLNAAQKALDAAILDLKSNAPWNSDWHSQRQRTERAAS